MVRGVVTCDGGSEEGGRRGVRVSPGGTPNNRVRAYRLHGNYALFDLHHYLASNGAGELGLSLVTIALERIVRMSG